MYATHIKSERASREKHVKIASLFEQDCPAEPGRLSAGSDASGKMLETWFGLRGNDASGLAVGGRDAAVEFGPSRMIACLKVIGDPGLYFCTRPAMRYSTSPRMSLTTSLSSNKH
jgi:hypothetical protein